MEDGSNLAKEFVPETLLPEYPFKPIPSLDHFDDGQLGIHLYTKTDARAICRCEITPRLCENSWSGVENFIKPC